MRRVAGVLMMLMGLALGAWIFYNLFIEMQPAAEGRNPIVPIGFSALLMYVGFKWAKGEQAG